MSGSQQNSWSDNPNAPKMPYRQYFKEKATFAGESVGAIFYGVIIVVFFRCMATLFNPTRNREEPIRWGLVSYTVVMFLVVTVENAMNLYVQSISYIDNREYPGAGGITSPGPFGYIVSVGSEAINIIPNVLFLINSWLADGLLLYRCYVVYSMNLWIIAFPCLMYLGSWAMGIVLAYQDTKVLTWAPLPYLSISLSLNVLLTLMIVIRLILHARTVRTAMGINGIGGMCKAIVTMLVESCALYAVSSLLVIGPWAAENHAADFFLLILAQTQVIAPLLIIEKVANRSALTNNTIVAGRISSFGARSPGKSADSGGALPSAGGHGVTDQLGLRVETTINSRQE